jgi:hypothetical protein
MSVIIGIDIGGSSTKIVGFSAKGKEWELIEPQIVKANDPVTSTYGAFGKYTDENNLAISDISKVMMTGVGASHVKNSLYGLKCQRVAEFDSIGRGGTYLSGLSEALVVSMGTGTAMVHAMADGRMKYLGGTGVGGGTLMGLSRLLLNADTISFSSNMPLAKTINGYFLSGERHTFNRLNKLEPDELRLVEETMDIIQKAKEDNKPFETSANALQCEAGNEYIAIKKFTSPAGAKVELRIVFDKDFRPIISRTEIYDKSIISWLKIWPYAAVTIMSAFKFFNVSTPSILILPN